MWFHLKVFGGNVVVNYLGSQDILDIQEIVCQLGSTNTNARSQGAVCVNCANLPEWCETMGNILDSIVTRDET
jgi:hypothetical protein